MPVLCDVNWLVALCYQSHSHHPRAKAWLDQGGGDEGLVVCRVAQLGLLRVLTNPAILMGDACTTQEAWNVLDLLMSDSRFGYRDEPRGLQHKLRELTQGYSFAPKLWQDAYLAAFAIVGKLRFVTFDAGFKKFKGLDCLMPGPG